MKKCYFCFGLVFVVLFLNSCDFLSGKKLNVSVQNESTYELTDIEISTGYTEVGADAEFTHSIVLESSLSAGSEPVGVALDIDVDVGALEVVKIKFKVNNAYYEKEMSFLYSYTHSNGSFDPGTNSDVEIIVSDEMAPPYGNGDPVKISIKS